MKKINICNSSGKLICIAEGSLEIPRNLSQILSVGSSDKVICKFNANKTLKLTGTGIVICGNDK